MDMCKRKLIYIHLCIIVILTFVNFWGSLANHFTYDDRLVISENDYFQSLFSFRSLFGKNYFKFSGESTYRLIVTLTYLIDYKIWGLSSFGFHFTNLFLHLATAIALYFFTSLLFKEKNVAFVSVLIFSAHPIHSEVINAIGFREDTLCTLFYILSLSFFVQLFKSKNGKYNIIYLIIAVVSFIISVFSKEMGITLPLILVLYFSLFGKKSVSVKRFVVYSIPFIVIVLFYAIVRFGILTVPPPEEAHYQGGSFINNFLTMSKVFIYYVFALCFPFRLKIQYDFPSATGLSDVLAIVSVVALVFIILFAIYLKRYSRIYTFSILFFFVTLLPVSNLIPIINFVAERYLYLPSIGFCFLLSFLINKIKLPSVKYVILIVLLCFYFVINYKQNKVWGEDLSLWEKAVQDAPDSFRVRYNLGSAYRLEKDYKKAAEQFERAIKLNPKYIDAYSSLAKTYYDQGKIEDAKRILQNSLNIAPEEPKVYLNLANTFRVCNEDEIAINLINRAIELDPNNPQCYLKLGAIYGEMKNYKSAIESFNKMIDLDANNPKGYSNLANALRLNGNLSEAVENYKKAIRLNPDDFSSHFNLGGLYFKIGEPERAVGEFKRAKSINPESLDVRYNLAISFLQMDDKENARNELEEILRIDPNYKQALIKLEENEWTE